MLLKVQGKPDEIFKAGTSFQVPPDTPHDACTVPDKVFKALAAYVARIVPPEGKLNDVQRRALLRLATAAARAGDDAALAALREHEGPRMDAGPLADMFRLLTADQVRSTADLKRAGQEAALAGRLPGQLKALQPTTGVTP